MEETKESKLQKRERLPSTISEKLLLSNNWVVEEERSLNTRILAPILKIALKDPSQAHNLLGELFNWHPHLSVNSNDQIIFIESGKLAQLEDLIEYASILFNEGGWAWSTISGFRVDGKNLWSYRAYEWLQKWTASTSSLTPHEYLIARERTFHLIERMKSFISQSNSTWLAMKNFKTYIHKMRWAEGVRSMLEKMEHNSDFRKSVDSYLCSIMEAQIALIDDKV